MRSFVAAFLACLATVVLLGLTSVVVGYSLTSTESPIEDQSYLIVELFDELLAFAPPGGLTSIVADEEPETLQRLLENLEKAGADDRIAGVIIKVAQRSSIGRAMAQEIRAGVHRVRKQGKKVYAWAESFNANQYLALAGCNEIIVPPTAYIGFTGFAARTTHVKGMLGKLGIKPNLHNIKDYKSAVEMLTRDNMSEPARENRTWMAAEFWDMFIATLRDDRKLDSDKIVGLMQHAAFTAAEAKEKGLVDNILYWDALESMLKDEEHKELRIVGSKRYASVERADLDLDGDKTIAIIHAQGMIGGRKNDVNPFLGLMMGHETIVKQLRRARLDEDVAAVVFRIDSRGGDALGSDLMGHEVQITDGVKPVVASMINVAASGGYHIAYRARRILANPMTVTGSIGSISGKFNVKALYDKLGITHDHVTKGPNAMMFSDLRDFNEGEKARFEENHWASFNHWLRDVAKHRNMTFEKAETLAHGRVWSGRQAAANGLVDEVGDYARAIEIAKELAGIPKDENINIKHYPQKKSLLAQLMGQDSIATALRWLVYRTVRQDIGQTVRFVAEHPDLLLQPVTP